MEVALESPYSYLYLSGGTDERLPEIFSNLTAGLERLGRSNPLALLVVITLLALGALILGYIQRREIVRGKEQFTLITNPVYHCNFGV